MYRRKYIVDENGYDNEEKEDGDDDDCSGGLVLNNQTCA
jgi:hypothetical protein